MDSIEDIVIFVYRHGDVSPVHHVVPIIEIHDAGVGLHLKAGNEDLASHSEVVRQVSVAAEFCDNYQLCVQMMKAERRSTTCGSLQKIPAAYKTVTTIEHTLNDRSGKILRHWGQWEEQFEPTATNTRGS